MVQERNIVMAIVLSLVTCGIYGIYWFICMTNEAGTLAEEPDFTGGKAFLFTLITCGIYGWYWSYKMGKVLAQAGEKKGVNISDNSLLYIILQIFGLGIVNYCIMQNDINTLAK